MSSTENKGISEIVMKLLLFMGIFAVAGENGKNEYKFDVGFNLAVVLILAILVAAGSKLLEIKMSFIEEKGDN